jgi:hypothetical protein
MLQLQWNELLDSDRSQTGEGTGDRSACGQCRPALLPPHLALGKLRTGKLVVVLHCIALRVSVRQHLTDLINSSVQTDTQPYTY